MTDPSRRLALTLADELARCGLTDVCLAPGSRSTPLVLAFAERAGIRLHPHLDERAAAFFAAGLARASRRPVAVISTSGTAAANFHPAVLEAHHGRVPLLVLTADRPARLRDAGANQTTDQLRLYGPAVRWFCEVPAGGDGGPGAGTAGGGPGAGTAGAGGGGPDPVWRWVAARAWTEASGPPAGPVHLNVAFDEPLVPGVGADGGAPVAGRAAGAAWVATTAGGCRPDAGEVERLATQFGAVERGLLVAGWGSGADPAAVDAFAAAAGWPVLADPLSGLRRGRHAVTCYDALLRAESFAATHRPELVLRLGAAPTSKALVEWLGPDVRQVLVDPAGSWQDPGHAAAELVRGDAGPLLLELAVQLASVKRSLPAAARPSGGAGTPPPGTAWQTAWRGADSRARQAIDELLDAQPEPSEPRAARDLVAGVPDGTTLVVGSSMPVRDVDAFAPAREGLRWVANRGLSGIDGFVATALGVAAARTGPVVGLCGDLSFLHDATSVLGAADRPEGAVFVVLDNDGGGIFSFLPQARLAAEVFEPLFATPHGLDLVTVAAAAGLPARRIDRAAELLAAVRDGLQAGGSRVIVVPTDRAANLAQHRALSAAVAGAVDAPG